MALLKVADFQTSQDGQSGYVLFKVIQPNGQISDWIGWKYVPIAGLASLQNILNSGRAYYDTETEIFTARHTLADVSDDLSEAMTLNPQGIEIPINVAKEMIEKTNSKRSRNRKHKK